ncbi:hypothetical protein Aple_060800 [Acrocarpospora pleiomorpha]|uniref:Uncharacterized protein n=1 Tax=Acrocarpospora pleiomorpha TaxID=90975 RepID=A0A5M3XUH1_9ACTN|nr:hypothetical protein [Acrocarpospora pleiomorpha]GES23181.1 hypothetical protein Aple_060800 [Acrocarpospora pleiomorpha]
MRLVVKIRTADLAGRRLRAWKSKVDRRRVIKLSENDTEFFIDSKLFDRDPDRRVRIEVVP